MLPADFWLNLIPTSHQLWRIAFYVVGTLAMGAILGGIWALVDAWLAASSYLGSWEHPPVEKHPTHRNGFGDLERQYQISLKDARR